MAVTIALFTRDLRVNDNPALSAAVREGAAVVPLFVVDDRMVGSARPAGNQLRFLSAALAELDAELRCAGGQLVIRRGDYVEAVDRVVAQVHADSVHVAEDATWYGRCRLRALRERLDRRSCLLHIHRATITAVDASDCAPHGRNGKAPDFATYFRRWLEAPKRLPLDKPAELLVPRIDSDPVPRFDELGDAAVSPQLAVGGEITGRGLWRGCTAGQGQARGRARGDLTREGFSRLSPYLHFGCLSAAEMVHRADMATTDGRAFVRLLARRDFHLQFLAARADIARSDDRHREPQAHDPVVVRAWRDGRTGYPIVDAGMRQLAAQGWMPQRARVIAASFLTTTLRVDWRVGADHFRRWLLDADAASNRFTWQQVGRLDPGAAGTGERYDPEGNYVRRWIPELAALPGSEIHRPWRHSVPTSVYPAPIAASAVPDESSAGFAESLSTAPRGS
ncbi:deoxyribodipyrimidine photo-lyase [Nocardia abscessus]|uniref:Deoxyribodipyrimidine photo-lyase n=1 Tax=Nocardia abscessus TaxID=120957 RepID=A0ABS0CCK2_9NOCA|nr:deoxyribodipyrimidine photo-lyase [Nocardia abscessus]MBF6228085.1 deoxyribodipyrimidine photo-lyase [Nocardia abscessus]